MVTDGKRSKMYQKLVEENAKILAKRIPNKAFAEREQEFEFTADFESRDLALKARSFIIDRGGHRENTTVTISKVKDKKSRYTCDIFAVIKPTAEEISDFELLISEAADAFDGTNQGWGLLGKL